MPLSRRLFLQSAALLAPLSRSLFATDRPAASSAAAPLPEGAFTAFPTENVAPASHTAVRKSEPSLVSLKDGTVLLAYATHTGHSDNDPAPIVARQLSASGLPMTEERIIVPPPPGGFNAMSPALRRLPDGRIGMLFSYRQSTTEASRRFTASSDEGATWSPPVIVAGGQYKTGCHDRFTVHSSGRLLAPCHCTDDWNGHYLHVRVARSDDAGATWTLGEPIRLPQVHWPANSGHSVMIESGCIEPGTVERADGSVLMTIRTAMGTQFKSESFDRGETWSAPHSMEVISPVAPAHLSRLPGSDHLLLLWNADYDPNAPLEGERHTIMSCVSTDGGRSWPLARRKLLYHDLERSVDYPTVLYRGDTAWITLRISTGESPVNKAFHHTARVLEGLTSTHLMKVPVTWF